MYSNDPIIHNRNEEHEMDHLNWEPVYPSKAPNGSQKLRNYDNNILYYQDTLTGIIVIVSMMIAGGIVTVATIRSEINSQSGLSAWRMIQEILSGFSLAGLGWGLFMMIMGSILLFPYKRNRITVFDGLQRLFYYGTKGKHSITMITDEPTRSFDDIQTLQIIAKTYIKKTRINHRTTYVSQISHELNIVYKDNTRTNISDNENLDTIQQEAIKLVTLLETTIWLEINDSILKDKENDKRSVGYLNRIILIPLAIAVAMIISMGIQTNRGNG